MAGGKETPRQKMIGMMYLVLTALLALNVSKTILDAFVAIEENTQKSNITHVDRGSEYLSDILSEIAVSKGAENAEKLKKLKRILGQMEKVDQLTSQQILKIDQLKLQLLNESGENTREVKNNDLNTIIWEKGAKCMPTRMNLMAVQAKDQYDVPMHILIGDDIKNPTGKGKTLWNDFNAYRSNLLKTVGTYQEGSRKYSISPLAINSFRTNKELKTKVDNMLKNSKANLRDDEEVLSTLYMNLTKPERVTQNDIPGVHWIGQTFDHAPLVAALASLSSMQQDILAARALALAHLKSKVSTGEFSFNSIVGLAYGPEVANAGEEIDLSVMMAAFDSDNQPTISYNGQTFLGANGMGNIKIKATNGAEMVLNGTVSIKNKAGITKTEQWKHTVKIMQPQGNISLPKMNVLYRGLDNEVKSVASGYDETILTGSGVSIVKIGKEGYKVRVTSSTKTASMSVYGKNNKTGKQVKLATVEYRVMPLPDPSFFFGAAEEGKKIPASDTRLFARYKDSPLDAKFEILSWTMTAGNAPRPEAGKGNTITTDAQKLIRQCNTGAFITFVLDYMGPDKVLRKKTVTFVK